MDFDFNFNGLPQTADSGYYVKFRWRSHYSLRTPYTLHMLWSWKLQSLPVINQKHLMAWEFKYDFILWRSWATSALDSILLETRELQIFLRFYVSILMIWGIIELWYLFYKMWLELTQTTLNGQMIPNSIVQWTTLRLKLVV